jgi:rhodanese-related sulfurtransferase
MSLLRVAVIVLTILVPPVAASAESATPAPSAPAAATAAKPPAKTKRYVVNLDAARAAKLLEENPGVVVLDVRTPEEFATGHLANAKNLDFKAGDFRDKLAALDRDADYLVHCAVGGRSSQTRDQMVELGFRHINHLEGGIEAWKAAGLPIVAP